jgi:hypothetical protein
MANAFDPAARSIVDSRALLPPAHQHRHRIGGEINQKVELPGQQVLHHQRGAIGHELKARAGLVLQKNTGEVRDAADATVHVDALSGFRFSQAISSLKLFAGMVFAAKITSGPDTTSATVAARFQ